MSEETPTWQDVSLLFSQPYWAADTLMERQEIGQGWISIMTQYGIALDQPSAVIPYAVTIYDHLRSRAMPLTTNNRYYWPNSALETYRLWVNQGCRLSPTDPIEPSELIPPPVDPKRPLRVRPDIRSLSLAELNLYRARVDDGMQSASPLPSSAWQINAYIHTNWCLHYQEAFPLWHRASLLHYERQIGMAVPYWNIMAADASVDGSPDGGIPQAFLDETYVHPANGEIRPNPLRYAAAKDGVNKVCTTAALEPGPVVPPAGPTLPAVPPACKWVYRDPIFYTSGDTDRAARAEKYAMVSIFQQQIVNALTWPVFSQPEGVPGMPWANITSFHPPQPDDLYPNRTDFDGLLEQPHDNWHGWIGGDMADNAFTAFDPVFWSYHAGIDRVIETWLRANPGATFTSSFPLQPFVGQAADNIIWSDPDKSLYTTIGDMARDSRALGYDYGPPVGPDFAGQPTTPGADPGGAVGAYVLFPGVCCIHDTYTVDVFLNQPNANLTDAVASNPHYVGRLTRLGMGVEDENGRCIRKSVTRVLIATPAARKLNVAQGEGTLTQVVYDVSRRTTVPPEQYLAMPGFQGYLVWGAAWPAQRPSSSGPTSATSSCCHMK